MKEKPTKCKQNLNERRISVRAECSYYNREGRVAGQQITSLKKPFLMVV